MIRTLALALALTAPLALVGCDETLDSAVESDLSAERFTVELTDAETAAVLAIANSVDFVTLDDVIALDRRAATGIIAARPIADLAALDAVPYVGDSALSRLYTYAADNGLINDGGVMVHGVEEGTEAAAAILLVANNASYVELDDDAGLDRRAATAIFDAATNADIGSLEELDGLSYVGARAFEKLMAFSETFEVDTTPVCPAGQIHSDEGGIYTNIADAVTRSGPGATLTVCAGNYSAALVQIRRPLTIVGQGNPTLNITQMYINVDVNISDVDITGRLIRIDGETGTYSGGPVVNTDNVAFSGQEILMLRSTLNAVDSEFTDIRELHLAYWARAVTNNSWFDGNTENSPVVHVNFGSHINMTGGGVINGEHGGVLLEGSAAHFNGVDFGIGSTDNNIFDFRGPRANYTWLHDDVTMSCNNNGCNL